MAKIFIITGEYSGDIHGGKVAEVLKQKMPDIEIEAIGGENLKNAGAKIYCDHSKMSGFGLSLKMIVDHVALERKISNYLLYDYKPDLVLLIDYGTFNLRIAKRLHNSGIKIFHYIPPQIWASRKWRINKIKKYVDKVLCIFPFEEDIYKQKNIDVHYCGHPLIQQLPPPKDKLEFFKEHSLDIDKPLVSVFPGSRPLELKFLAKTLINSAKELKIKHPEIQFCISHAPNLSDEVFEKYVKDADFKIIKGENQALLSVSDALILASGTVALEATLYKIPMIIGYRGPRILYLVYLMLRCINRVSLPNIISGEDIVPELIQLKFNKENICYEIERLLYEKEYRKSVIDKLGRVREKLSEKYSAEEVAECIINALS